MTRFILFFLALVALQAQESRPFFQDLPEGFIQTSGTHLLQTRAPRTSFLEETALDRFLDRVPQEFSPVGALLLLPSPNGEMARFEIWNSPIMEEALATRYPEIRTFKLKGIDDPTATGRCDWTPLGFHAMVRSAEGSWYIDPYAVGDSRYYQSYRRNQLIMSPEHEWSCELVDDDELGEPQVANLDLPRRATGGELYTYRVAIAATGEYTAVFGGTVQLGLAAVVVALNRVNEVYETDVALRMILVANNDLIIYTNPSTDPYTNSSGSTMLGENQTNLTNVIGNANYDIGHVFSTGGGGIASLGSACTTGSKARGVTGRGNPVGDAFYIDYVAHEMGHQWDCPHTFNGTVGSCGGGNRSAGSAYEPGSGSTIMAYAGICGSQDLQPNSDPDFHNKSYADILQHTRVDRVGCAVILTSSNQAPTVSAGTTYTIPANTPFMLTAVGTDPDGPTGLTYQWQQYDLGDASPPDTDNGNRPIFRSFIPSSSPIRFFPKLTDILNQTTTYGESLPTTNRTLTFRVLLRDNDHSGAGTDVDEVALTVSNAAGPFQVTSQSSPLTADGLSSHTVTWNVANTDSGSVNTDFVDIYFSANGTDYDTLLLGATPNDGSADVTIPNLNTTSGRIMVRGTNNIFFDINHAPITVTELVLQCTSDFENWRALTAGQFSDVNPNGFVDVIDLLLCLGL